MDRVSSDLSNAITRNGQKDPLPRGCDSREHCIECTQTSRISVMPSEMR